MRELFSLDGKIAVLTGGSGQLGQQYIKALSEYGARIAVFDVMQAQSDSEEVKYYTVDITKRDAVDEALRQVFDGNGRTAINNTKSFIGHAMGAAGVLELAGNLPAFDDRVCHPTINADRLDPECELPGLVIGQPREKKNIRFILSNSFGMLGINSVVIIAKV